MTELTDNFLMANLCSLLLDDHPDNYEDLRQLFQCGRLLSQRKCNLDLALCKIR